MKPQAESELKLRDPQEVATALGRLSTPFRAGRWLDLVNIYRADPVSTLAGLPKGQRALINPADMGDYLAASVALHCSDAWAYLGRALTCLTHGDATAAIHMGYYASLRGAMAILALQSIGVFDNRHVVLRQKGVARVVPGITTHSFTWDALAIWARSDEAGRRLPSLFRLPGMSVADWVDEFSPGFDLVARASDWEKRWGFDPQNLDSDHVLRNQSSYRPSEHAQRHDTRVRTSTAFLNSLWRASEPASVPFEPLMRHIVRISLEFVATETGLTQAGYRTAVVRAVEALIEPAAQANWTAFLTRMSEPNDLPILTHARAISAPGVNAHLEVMARAFVLLTVATLHASEFLDGASVGRRRLSFWWRQLGADRGLWARSSPPGRFQDLWEDVRDALDEMDNWVSRQTSPTLSNAVWRKRLAWPLGVLATPERIPLWGLAL